ncbi:unnamed protein product [Prunus armeniaca]
MRPISLCNTLYKTISKILASFILGRLISDNIVLAHELLHKFRHSKGKKGEIKLSAVTIKIIMQCVTTVHFQVNLNGEATSSFAPERGLRQEASTRQARVMKRCLDKFCQASSQVVSFEKSQIFRSPNVPNSLAAEISSICESPLTSNLGKYLGVPLIHSRINKATYRSVVDKVQQKLTAWKGKLLSLPGKATLIQSVTASIPLYTMQTAHLVKWDTVCKSKKKGGLGLKQTDLINQSMLAKVGWRLLQHKESL